jgi:outer membrane lipoprotein LolB
MKQILIVILSLLLAACATLPASQEAQNKAISWSARQHQLTQITHWHINGAIAIKIEEHGQTASIDWQQQALKNYVINLYGPLGMGRVTLTGTPEQVTLFAAGKSYKAATPEALMQQVLGWQLPVQNLYYWIRGITAPTLAAKIDFDRFHHIQRLQQQGWQVNYQRYTSTDGIDLPSLLSLQHGNLHVKIVISRWEL